MYARELERKARQDRMGRFAAAIAHCLGQPPGRDPGARESRADEARGGARMDTLMSIKTFRQVIESGSFVAPPPNG